jgi:hypothetical protein
VPGIDGAALDSDILAQAEAIRRERLERRQKKAAEVKKEVLVGNLIGEDHVNYVLMYNMLTGIRIGVSDKKDQLIRYRDVRQRSNGPSLKKTIPHGTNTRSTSSATS